MPIEKHAPGLDRIIDVNQQIEELASGFGAESGPAEGPVWWHEEGHLIFSDIGHNRRMKWSSSEGCSLFHEPTNEANGLTRDRVVYGYRAVNSNRLQTRYDQPIFHLIGGADHEIRSDFSPVCLCSLHPVAAADSLVLARR